MSSVWHRDPLAGLMDRIAEQLARHGPMSLADLEQAFEAWGNIVLLAVDRLCEENRVVLVQRAEGYEVHPAEQALSRPSATIRAPEAGVREAAVS